MSLEICVEGGGAGDLRTECRRAFNKLLEKAGFAGRQPRVIACGGRNQAFKDFRTRLEKGQSVLLLVDSEDAVVTPTRWAHVEARDTWSKPVSATEADLHFMIRSMEAWLLADREKVASWFGKDFRESALPPSSRPVEDLDRRDSVRCLEEASRETAKGRYGKGAHSFDLLSEIDPGKLETACPSARAFFAEVRRRTTAPKP